ncbi:hypothetical protein WICPIJ_003561 [Wickerhamomyces pijperi]|uniref:t-SNARE coiled-coil homology domain-containing protein n=1 Tax=Wickerhamomyces pijperi TaxID=599730 RepID=A0A9P8TP37_WICPI|nr:hypothetical protein WICPIJ_003561 [Wickerhamomyces pijperi]
MSFNTFDVDLEGQSPFTDSPEFDTYSTEASNILLDLNNQLVTLQKFINVLQTKNSISGTEQINSKALKIIDTCTNQFKRLSTLVKEISSIESLNPAQLFTKERVSHELKDSLAEFQELQTNFKQITDTLNQEARSALYEEQTQSSPVVANEQQQQTQLILEEDIINNEEFVYQQNMIRERDQEISNIQQGIQELNEIFQDLGTIVQEQGTMVDNIESNIHKFSTATKGAAQELHKAFEYQRRSKSKSFCFLMILVVLLTVVILGIFL